MRRMAIVALALALAAAATFAAACSIGSSPATPTPPPTSTETPPVPTDTPAPAATATPALDASTAIVVGGDLRVRNAPSTAGPVVRTLKDMSRVQIDRAVDGENVLVSAQTWVSTIPDWTRLWFRLTDGTYVYASYIFIPAPGEESPFTDPHGEEKWIDVNVTTQTATAMIGGRAVHTAPVSTGSPQFPSPLGTHHIENDGRIAVERMTASQAGYTPGQATYDVENVLFTQYYDRKGDALHLNYWRPVSVFGHTPTSHGCVGMLPHDAQWFWLFGAPGMRVEIHT